MCTDIAHTTTFAGLFGIGTPGCLCIAFALSEPAEPALRIFYPNLADPTQCAILHQLPGQFEHRITWIGMSEQQCQTGSFNFHLYFMRFFKGKRYWIFNHYRKAF